MNAALKTNALLDRKFRRIPQCAVMLALIGTVFATGCSRDDGGFDSRNAPAAYSTAHAGSPSPRNPTGPGYAQGPGYSGYDSGGRSDTGQAAGDRASPIQAGFPPRNGGYQPQGGGYQPQGGGYQPQGGGNEPQGAGYQPQGGYSPQGGPPQPGGRGDIGQAGQGGGRGGFDELMQWERQDMGVRASNSLHEGSMHGPTPNQIPGGQVITTKGLVPLLQQGVPVFVFDVLGSGQSLPNAIPAAAAAQAGSFEDETQQRFGQMLQQVTRGNNEAALVFYCAGPQCWMSYNASLRAIQLGYRNVLWYRGGVEAWQRAGLQLASGRI